MAASKTSKRLSARKQTHPIHVSHMTSLTDFTKIAKDCEIIQASISGLLMQVRRADLLPSYLRQNLNIDSLVGDAIFLRLEDMNLEISGKIARTEFIGKAGFLIAVDYSEDSPEYWRECLMDLLPQPGELD